MAMFAKFNRFWSFLQHQNVGPLSRPRVGIQDLLGMLGCQWLGKMSASLGTTPNLKKGAPKHSKTSGNVKVAASSYPLSHVFVKFGPV